MDPLKQQAAADYIRSLGDLWSGNEYMATNLVWDMAKKNGWSNEDLGAGMGFTPDQITSHFGKYGYTDANASPGLLTGDQGRAPLSFHGPAPGTGKFTTGGETTPSPGQVWTAETFGQQKPMAPEPQPSQAPATHAARDEAVRGLLGMMPNGPTQAPTTPTAPATASPTTFGTFTPPSVTASDGWKQFFPEQKGLLQNASGELSQFPGLLEIMQRHKRF